VSEIEVRRYRQPEADVDELFVRRWSPRAMSGEAIGDGELMTLFEAARWAPSSNNGQPWRFVYAKRGTPAWPGFFELLVQSNQRWAKQAAVLVIVVARRTFEHDGSPSPTHAFDAGAAWACLALQASLRGLVAHGMRGFDHDRARAMLDEPDGYAVQAMVAIGRPGNVEDLPERLQAREVPSGRKPLAQLVFEGRLPAAPPR
jgi:nitroreductase